MTTLTRNPSADWTLNPTDPLPSIPLSQSGSASHSRSVSRSNSANAMDAINVNGNSTNMIPTSPLPRTNEDKSRALALQAAAKGTVSPPASSPNSWASGEDVGTESDDAPGKGTAKGKKRKLEVMVEVGGTAGSVNDENEGKGSVVDLTASSPITSKTSKRPKTDSTKPRKKPLPSTSTNKNAEASSSKTTLSSKKAKLEKGEKGEKGEGKSKKKKVENGEKGKEVEKGGKKGKSEGSGALIELKTKKLSLNQKPLLPQITKYNPFIELKKSFQVWLKKQDEEDVVTELPREFWGLVVLGGMESAEPTPKKLADSLKNLLIDDKLDQGEEDVAELSSKAITSVISQLLTLESYGFQPADFVTTASLEGGEASTSTSISTTGTTETECKIPDAYALHRWEVLDTSMVPTEEKMREKLIKRMEVRVQARKEARVLATGLSEEQVAEILGVSGRTVKNSVATVKAPVEVGTSNTDENAMDVDVLDQREENIELPQVQEDDDDDDAIEVIGSSRAGSAAPSTTRSASPDKGKLKGRPKKVETEEQKEKRVAKEKRKEAKEAAEAKAADEKAKSAALMQSFFVKPKVQTTTTPVATTSVVAGPSSPAKRDREVARRDRSASRTDAATNDVHRTAFNETFKDFVPKLNCAMAEPHAFQASRSGRQGEVEEDVSAKSANELVQDFLAASRRQARPPRPVKSNATAGLGPRLKTEVLYMTIPELLIKGQEADDPRAVYASLRDPRRFPMKTLSFHEDSRPAYHGTWAKASPFVGPRTPFAMDPVLDYSIDEGPDWEAPEGDDQDIGDGLNDDASEKSESESSEDDLDGWLCDDSEIEMMEGFDAGFAAGVHPMDLDEGFLPPAPAGSKGKGKAKDKSNMEEKEKEKPKKGEPHRKVEKLIQFQCGPIWEVVIGEETAQKAYKGFEQYQIRLLNDTPSINIDPWNWHSAEVKPAATVASDVPNSKPASSNVSPAIPTGAAAATATGTMGPPAPRFKPASMKSQFPVAHLSAFLNLIQGSDKSGGELLKELYAKFEGKATKASMKTKFEAVAARTGARSGSWNVSAEALAEAKSLASSSS